MGGGALLFIASHGIRFRAQPASPLRPRTGRSSFCAYRRDAVQRCLAIRLEANKGAQSQRNSKSKLELSVKLNSETSTDEADSREELASFLRKIEASIKRGSSVAERNIGRQEEQPLEPKCEDKETSFDHSEYTGPPSEILKKDDASKVVAPAGYEKMFNIFNDTTGEKKVIATSRNDIKSSGPPSYSDKMIRANSDNAVAPSHNDIKSSGPPSYSDKMIRANSDNAVAPSHDIKSSGPPSYSDKMIRDNGNNAVATLCNDIKSSGPPSNFDKLIRDNGDNAVALLHNYKPPRPTSRFVRRSPIPISSPAKQEESLKQRVSIADNMRAIWEKPRDVKPVLKLDRISMLKAKTASKLRNKMKARPKLKPNSEFEAMINSKLRDIRKAELELEPNSDLEALTISELRDIPEAESELESTSELEAVMVSELGDIPKVEPELEPNSELEAVTISQLRDIPKEPELEAMTLSELRGIAKARGLKGYTRIKKAKLVEILKGTSL